MTKRLPNPSFVGRPRVPFSEPLALAILDAVASGSTLRSALSAPGMPSRTVVQGWADTVPEFGAALAQARNIMADQLADETLEIADDKAGDYLIYDSEGNSTGVKVHSEYVQRSKLRIETRRWLVGTVNPARYAANSKLELSNPDGSLVPKSDTDIAARAAALLELARHRRDGLTPDSQPSDDDDDLDGLI